MSTADARSFLESIGTFIKSSEGGPGGAASLGVKMATVDPAYTSGLAKVIFDGETAVNSKGYAWDDSYLPKAGDRVFLIPAGSSYIIGGKIQSTYTAPAPPIRYAEFYNNGFGVAGGSVGWDIGPLTFDSALSTAGDFAVTGGLSGELRILEAGWYSFSHLSEPNTSPGNAAIFLRRGATTMTVGNTNGYSWEMTTSVVATRVEANTTFRYTMTATNAHTLKSRVRIHKLA